jgi:di/tricarboxylate transporter
MLILNQTGVAQILAGSVSGWVDCMIAGVILLVAFHAHSVFARLVALRPRLFMGDEVIAADET